jgi:hypothetical protein
VRRNTSDMFRVSDSEGGTVTEGVPAPSRDGLTCAFRALRNTELINKYFCFKFI